MICAVIIIMYNVLKEIIIFLGEAIADGCALKIDYFSKHHGLTEEQKHDMTITELEDHEARMTEKNAWCIAEGIVNRIDDEPGPGGGFMQAFITDKPGNSTL